MPQRTEVYAQIVPVGFMSRDYRVRLLLPYGRDTMPSDVRSTWGTVEHSLARALRIARDQGGTELPNQLEDSMAVEMTVPGVVVDDPRVDLARAITLDLQRTINAAIKSRDADRRN